MSESEYHGNHGGDDDVHGVGGEAGIESDPGALSYFAH